jgi:Histidine kinase-, DNA gyrase B-, and HSP90-like ATPase
LISLDNTLQVYCSLAKFAYALSWKTKGAMLGHNFANSGIWQKYLAARPDDEFATQRERLRIAFEAMRRNVEPLVAAAHIDCDGLTVHDVSHLDALWHTASIIAGDEFDLTPAEAFVLGGAILLHDAGMAFASYKGGIDEIRKTPEWRDAYASMKGGTIGEDGSLDPHVTKAADFQALRRLHAAKGESLAIEPFPSANDDNVFYLIEDQQIRQSYGTIIGQIAHSHHWDIDQLKNLPESIGAIPSFPQGWTINSIKVATLLRCADAAHIDSDRAPSMLFSLNKPQGVSFTHWNFQNNILQPQVVARKLVFSSSRPFAQKDAESWWLSYEIAKMIDYELSSSCALLKTRNLPVFEVEGVQGTETPAIFASYIQTKDWIPVNSEIVVSNPSYVAATLGGKNLYGDDPFIPIREMIQNAADAIRARRIVDRKDNQWGKISIELGQKKSGEFFVTISDNGIGMSERTLTGPLIDFGKSSWSSSSMQDEFPGLLSEGYKPTGKFGIGFFSTFMLGGQVEVISRRYDEGADKSRMLRVPSLDKRPMLTSPSKDEIDVEISTKISINIENHYADVLLGKKDHINNKPYIYHDEYEPLEKRIRKFIATLDIYFEYVDSINKISFNHRSDWYSSAKENIVSNMNGLKELSPDKAYLAELFDFVYEQGSRKITGFATLPIVGRMGSFGSAIVYNGLSYGTSMNSEYRPYSLGRAYQSRDFSGVMPGEIIDAARQSTTLSLAGADVAEWATNIGRILSSSKISPIESMHACQQVMNFGGNSEDLFFCFHSGNFVSHSDFIKKISELNQVFIPISIGYKVKLTSVDDLSAAYFTAPLLDGVVCTALGDDSIDFIDNKEAESIKESNSERVLTVDEIFELRQLSSVGIVLDPIQKHWDQNVEISICKEAVFEPTFLRIDRKAWVLKITKS